MAQSDTAVLRDDLTGGKAAETVSFGLDGKTYEIDLNKRNAAALRKVIRPYVQAGRPIAKTRRRRQTATKIRASTPPRQARKPVTPSPADIRVWAAEHGVEVPARGRISQAVRDQYLAAHAR